MWGYPRQMGHGGEFRKKYGSLEKGTVTSQETEPDLPVSVQEFPTEAWVDSGLPSGQGH